VLFGLQYFGSRTIGSFEKVPVGQLRSWPLYLPWLAMFIKQGLVALLLDSDGMGRSCASSKWCSGNVDKTRI
jgi:hypothetical protein